MESQKNRTNYELPSPVRLPTGFQLGIGCHGKRRRSGGGQNIRTDGQLNSYKPGSGWVNISLGGPVWEHRSGVRIHVLGMAGFPGDPIINGRNWPRSQEVDRFVAINGGNRKRGVMAWALSLDMAKEISRLTSGSAE